MSDKMTLGECFVKLDEVFDELIEETLKEQANETT